MKTMRNRQTNQQHSSRDAIRVLLALVFILFASIASREHESPEKTLEQQELAESQVEAQNTPRSRESKPSSKLSDLPLLSRLSGAISGAI